jgi:prepilin signal peptidase PulO-like enzyme (type II secretory pathway)
MLFLKIIFIFILGTFFGSFANVLIDRGQKGKKITGRSKCDFCGYQLSWSDNIPIISFFLLGGKCRKCKKKLSWQYPIVEFGMGLVFVLMAKISGFLALSLTPRTPLSAYVPFSEFGLLFYLFIGFILSVIFVWDLKYMIIPDYLVGIGFFGTLAWKIWLLFSGDCSLLAGSCSIVWSVAGGAAVGGFFYLMHWYSKGKWIGGGDVKLGFFLGFLLGWQNIYWFLLFSYVLGAAVGLLLMGLGRKKMNSQIPFGPFLIIGAIMVMMF